MLFLGCIIFIKMNIMTENDLQQIKRVLFGSYLGFILPKIFDWDYGTYFSLYPILIMGLSPVINAHIIRQFLFSGVFSVAVAYFITVNSSVSIVTTITLSFSINVFCFWIMSTNTAFLAGAQSLISIHTLTHLGSYQSTNLSDVYTSVILATFITAAIVAISFYFFPDRHERTIIQKSVQSNIDNIKKTMLGSVVSSVSLMFFMLFDEKDSIAAQVSSLLVLFPINWNLIFHSSIKRIYGTIIGSSTALIIQVIVSVFNENIFIISFLYCFCIMLYTSAHIKENAGPAKWFVALTTLSVIVGMKTMNSDISYSSLYRLTSVPIAIVVTIMITYIIHLVINQLYYFF